jgi:hypothetical protein
VERCQAIVFGFTAGGLPVFPGEDLFSFVLETLTEHYFQDYTLSIRWRPAAIESGTSSSPAIHEQNDAGSYELSFSRLGKGDENPQSPSLWNPHSDLEGHFTRRLQDDLAAGDIASFALSLRDSLPVLLEVERVATRGNINGRIDIFYKAVGWYRVLIDSRYAYLLNRLLAFNERWHIRLLRYALDFRLLSRRRLAILDGTQVLERVLSQPHSSIPSTLSSILAPIPHIEAITSRLVAEPRMGPGVLISLTKGVLVSFDESGVGIENVGVRFVERIVKTLTMGEAGLV